MKKIRIILPCIKSHFVQFLTCAISIFESIMLCRECVTLDPETEKYIITGNDFLLTLYLLILFFSICGLLYEIGCSVSDYRKDHGRIFSDDDKESIDKYLTHFIKTGESIAILTHDMSWINEENFQVLKRKAERKELLLFLPSETEKVKELEKLGADVRYYGEIINDPTKALIRSRMTVVNWNKAFPKLTYPIKKDGLHINYEVSAGEPANQLALDLIQLLILTAQIAKKEEMYGMNLVRMLEELTHNDRPKGEYLFHCLEMEDQGKVVSWYSKYCNKKTIVITEVVELMTFFHKHENLDFYDNVEFGKIRREICDKYDILPGDFLSMYISFREMTSQ